MNTKSIVSSIGALAAIYGIASAVMYFVGYNLRILIWIDTWGTTVGWVIRVALIVVGAIMYFVGKKTA